MPAPYALPSGNNVTTIQGLLQYSNSVSGFFGILLLSGTFVIPFVVLTSRFGKLKAFTTASWFSFLSSIFMTIIDIVPQESIAITFSLVIISIILLWKS